MIEKLSWKDKFNLIKNILFNKIEFKVVYVCRKESICPGRIITKTDDDIKKELSIDIAKTLLDNGEFRFYKTKHEQFNTYSLYIKIFNYK